MDASPLRQVLEATGAGALVGSMIGAISSYLKSPVVVGYSRAPVWRDVSVELFSSTKWWAGTFFTYVFVKNFSAQARGLSQPDGLSSFTAGAVTGAIYTLRYGIAVPAFPFPPFPSLRSFPSFLPFVSYTIDSSSAPPPPPFFFLHSAFVSF